MTDLEQAARALLEAMTLDYRAQAMEFDSEMEALRAALDAETGRASGSSTDLELEALMRRTGTEGYPSDVRRLVEAVRNAALEEAAAICDITPPQPFRPSIEAAHAIRQLRSRP